MHLITGLEKHGAEHQLMRLVQASKDSSFQHSIVSMMSLDRLDAKQQLRGVDVQTLEMQRGVPSLIGLVRLVKLLRRRRPQILHCWMYHANLLGLLAGKLAHVRHIVWGIRGSELDFSYYRRLTRCVVALGARLSRLPDAIVCNSAAGRRAHERYRYYSGKMYSIPNGFDLQNFRPDQEARRSVRAELGLDPKAFVIGLIARLDPMKDHATFFKAARLLSRRYPSTRFLLAGTEVTWENAQVSRMLFENGLNGVVHLLGCRDDVPRLTAGLDIASSSSAFGEGFSNAIGEAMACQVPCVVTDVGDSALIVGDTGRVVPPRSPEALARAWAELIEMDPVQRQELGRRARMRSEENFALSKVVTSYEILYESIVMNVGSREAYTVAD